MLEISDFFTISSFGNEFAYVGLMIISFILSIIVFVPVPYFPILITAAFDSKLNPHLIAFYAALGTLGAKMIIFYASYYGRKMLGKKVNKKIATFQRFVSRYGWGGAFVAAVTPIPDDLVYIPLGLAKYNPLKFASATFAGKFIMNEFIVWGSVYLGRPFVESISGESADPIYLVTFGIISIIILVIIIYSIFKLDYAKLIRKYFPKIAEKYGLNDDNNDDEINNNNNNNNNNKDKDDKSQSKNYGRK